MTFGYAVDSFATWLGSFGLPGLLAVAVAMVCVWVLPVAAVVFPIAGLGQIIERKIAAAIQRRVGPSTVGIDGVLRFVLALSLPFLTAQRRELLLHRILTLPGLATMFRFVKRSGLGQLLADGVKMLGKEDFVPAGADRIVFTAAPYLALTGAFLAFVVVPFGQHWVMAELDIGLVYVAAVSGLVVLALLMAGWGSNNKWSLLGGMRAVAQVVSYEIPVGLCLAAVALWCGTLNLHQIIAFQAVDHQVSFLGWNLFANPFMPVIAGLYFFAALAECHRTPFDLAEAESELVSGFNTEYSGLRWGMFAMAEYTDMILVGCLFSVCFLGGYQSPFFDAWITALPVWVELPIHAGILVAKFTAVLVVMVWIRWTLPRFRIDQVMRLCWLKLVPLALICLFGTALTLLLSGAWDGGLAAPGSYGRVALAPHITYSVTEQLAAWIVGGGLILLVLAWARRGRRDTIHPTLARLTGATP